MRNTRRDLIWLAIIGAASWVGDARGDGIVFVSDQGAGVVDPAVVFVGCTFINGGSTTIDNQTGVATKVQAIGCVNLTPNLTLGSITETGTVRVA